MVVLAASMAKSDKFTESVLIYEILPASYKRCATVMVCATEKLNFLDASCCSVDVVNGAEGDFLAGFFSRSRTKKSAPISFVKNACASSSVLNREGSSALMLLLPSLNSAVTLYNAVGLNCNTSRSLSTTIRTATDCTRPADKPALIFFQRTGDISKPTKRS